MLLTAAPPQHRQFVTPQGERGCMCPEVSRLSSSVQQEYGKLDLLYSIGNRVPSGSMTITRRSSKKQKKNPKLFGDRTSREYIANGFKHPTRVTSCPNRKASGSCCYLVRPKEVGCGSRCFVLVGTRVQPASYSSLVVRVRRLIEVEIGRGGLMQHTIALKSICSRSMP